MHYCVEIWGNTYKTNTNPVCLLQKKAAPIVNQSDYLDPTNALFINVCALKFFDLVDYKIVQIIYKVHNKLLPNCSQRLFKTRESI